MNTPQATEFIQRSIKCMRSEYGDAPYLIAVRTDDGKISMAYDVTPFMGAQIAARMHDTVVYPSLPDVQLRDTQQENDHAVGESAENQEPKGSPQG